MTTKADSTNTLEARRRRAVRVLRESADFSSAAERTVNRLTQAMICRRFPAQTILFWEGDSPGVIQLVERGTIRLTASRSDGGVFFVSEIGPGELLGVSDVLRAQPRSVTAYATQDVVAWDIGALVLQEALRTDPLLSYQMLLGVLGMASARERHAALSASQTITQRLATVLTGLLSSKDAGPIGQIRISHAELALRVGAARESITRSLSFLRERGIIETKRRGISVLQPDRLRRLSLSVNDLLPVGQDV